MQRFLKGAMSGAFSGAVMMGIVGIVSVAAPGFIAWSLGTAAAMVLCTSLFGGVMGAVRTSSPSAPRDAGELSAVETLTPTIAQGHGVMPQVGMDAQPEAAPEAAPARTDGKSWVDVAGKSAGTPSRLDSILADGTLSDKDRASAILAARESGGTQASR